MKITPLLFFFLGSIVSLLVTLGACFELWRPLVRYNTKNNNNDQNKRPYLLWLSSLSSQQPDPTTRDASVPAQCCSSRFIALQALLPGKKKNQFPIDGLESNPHFHTLPLRDRSFCRLLVTTVERRQGQLDAVIDRLTIKKKKKRNSTVQQRRRDEWLRTTLRLGAAQLLFLHVPAHAAVQETVQLLRIKTNSQTFSESEIGFVNAVLRAMGRQQFDTILDDVSLNAAPWLVDECRANWGVTVTRGMLEAAMHETPRVLSVNHQYHDNTATTTRDTPIQWVADCFGEGAEILPQNSIRIANPPRGPVSLWPLYNDGAWWCQDVSATLPALALYHYYLSPEKSDQPVDLQTNKPFRIVDLCAAPGGKTAQLCSFGFQVTAVEVSPRRAKRWSKNMKRLHMMNDTMCNLVIADGTQWRPEQLVDGVVLDVPCTATGTASKRPDVLRRSSDCSELLEVQSKLARHAAVNIVRPGGIIVYATCSVLKRESEDQVHKLLRDTALNLESIPFRQGEIPGFDDAIDENGWLRVLPGAHSIGQCDGFFVARLRRTR